MKKPKMPAEDPSTIALRDQQVLDLSKLDQEENTRVKQLLIGQRGGRFFRGSPLLRAKPGDRSGGGGGGGMSAPSVAPSSPSFDAGAGYVHGLFSNKKSTGLY